MRNQIIGAGAALTIGLFCGLSGDAQDRGAWRALSKTAKAVTGDVGIGTEKLVINFINFPISQTRSLDLAALSAVFDLESNATGSGSLYRLSIPGAMRFLHKNTMCGGEDTQWMVTYVDGKNLQLAFFSGSRMPELTRESVAHSTDLCGTYSYIR